MLPHSLVYAWQQVDGAADLVDYVVASAPAGDVKATLASFMTFSQSTGLGIHLGQEKGDQLQIAVARGLPERGPAAVLEMGCQAGDRTLSAILALVDRPGSIVVSMIHSEEDSRWLEAAARVVGHATAERNIRFAPMIFGDYPDGQSFDRLLNEVQNTHGVSKFDAIVFGHDEKSFLSHLKVLLRKGFLRQGSTIYADHVKRKARHLRNYLGFVHSKARNGFNTVTKFVKLPYPDAVAISTFVGSPSEL